MPKFHPPAVQGLPLYQTNSPLPSTIPHYYARVPFQPAAELSLLSILSPFLVISLLSFPTSASFSEEESIRMSESDVISSQSDSSWAFHFLPTGGLSISISFSLCGWLLLTAFVKLSTRVISDDIICCCWVIIYWFNISCCWKKGKKNCFPSWSLLGLLYCFDIRHWGRSQLSLARHKQRRHSHWNWGPREDLPWQRGFHSCFAYSRHLTPDNDEFLFVQPPCLQPWWWRNTLVSVS